MTDRRDLFELIDRPRREVRMRAADDGGIEVRAWERVGRNFVAYVRLSRAEAESLADELVAYLAGLE